MFLFKPFTLSTVLKAPKKLWFQGLPALIPKTMDEGIARFFKNPKLVQIMRRFATYNGSDPRRTPQTFNVIPYAEWRYGVWHPKGGIYSIVKALETVALELGVTILTDTEVTGVNLNGHKQVTSVNTSSGSFDCRHLVVNEDAVHAIANGVLSQTELFCQDKPIHCVAKKPQSVAMLC